MDGISTVSTRTREATQHVLRVDLARDVDDWPSITSKDEVPLGQRIGKVVINV
jgi:hypothetical protein